MFSIRRVTTAIALMTAGSLLAAGCGDGGGSGDFDQGDVAAVDVDTLAEVKERGELVVGVRFDVEPYGFVPEGQSTPVGFEIDLAEQFAEDLGVDVSFVQVTSDNRIPNLQTGKVDMLMASMIRTPERLEVIDFSRIYFSDEQTLMVPAGSDIEGVDDLDGKTVAVAQGGAEGAQVEKVAPGAELLTLQSWPNALQAMLRGEADAISSTVGLLFGLQGRADAAGRDVEIVGDSFAEGPIGAGFRQGDTEMFEAFDETLKRLVDSGTYADIYRQWWSGVSDVPYDVDFTDEGVS